MLILHMRPQRPRKLCSFPITFFLLCLFSLFLTTPVAAQVQAGGPTILNASLGFDGVYQDGNWIPIQIDLSNNGPDFTGTVSVSVPSITLAGPGPSTSANTYQEAINLPPGSKKHVTISAPVNLNMQGSTAVVSVNLIDKAGHRVTHKDVAPANNTTNITLIGVLSDTPNNFSQLNIALASLFSTAGQQKNLTAASFPTQAAVLKNFDVLVIDNFASATLSTEQLSALQSWINQGGNVILVGGPEWKRTLGNLPANLLPVTLSGTGTVPAGTHLLPVSDLTKNGPDTTDTLNTTISISSATLTPQSTALLSTDRTPLIAQKLQGQGSIYYLAYDPTIEPLASWSHTSNLWSTLLLRSLGDRMLMNSNTANPSGMQAQTNNPFFALTSLLQTFFPNAYPSIWLVLALLLSYILLLGPIRLLLVRAFKRRDWSWRIVLATIVTFTILSYGLALQQKGSTIINSSITVIQLNPPDATGSTGHETTLLGVFVPSQGDFQVHIPGARLVQPAEQNLYGYSQPRPSSAVQQSTFTIGSDSTDVNLQGVDIWTTRSLMAQHDIHTSGGITSQLQLRQNIVSGTVSSTLPYALTDAFVLLGDNYVALGELPANSTKHITITLTTSNNSTHGSQTIADQIASSRGMITNNGNGFYTNTNNNQSGNNSYRHTLMLEAMSGSTCGVNNCYSQPGPMIIPNANGVSVKHFMIGNSMTDRDPLLLPGSLATIIGWSQQPVTANGDITVNGQTANGSQETMVQAPLNVNFTGNIQLPSSIIDSRIVHIQQSQPGNVQEPFPGTYMLNNGSMTLEYTLPQLSNLQNSAFTFTSSVSPVKGMGQSTGTSTNINQVQTYLYNWHTGNWDSVRFREFTCSVKVAQDYVGPGGRVLLNVNNHDTSAVFDKPTLTVQGTVAN